MSASGKRIPVSADGTLRMVMLGPINLLNQSGVFTLNATAIADRPDTQPLGMHVPKEDLA